MTNAAKYYRPRIWPCFGLFAVLALASCSSSAPYAAESNRALTADEARARQVLTDAEQARIDRAFTEMASGRQAVNRPISAPFGMRWTDVELAVIYACNEAEMAILQSAESESGLEYRLLTIEDWPARLTIRKTNDQRVYAADATVGRFGDHEDRAEELLKALEEQMRAFGKKKRFDNDNSGAWGG